MSLLRKVCSWKLWKGLSRRKRACNATAADTTCRSERTTVACSSLQELDVEPDTHGEDGTRTEHLCAQPELVTRSSGRDLDMLPTSASGAATDAASELVSSGSDSGVCLGGEEGEEQFDDSASELSEDEEEEEEYECKCEEWHIAAKDLTLNKVQSSQPDETVYSGYWHGSVTVHQRQSTKQTELNFYIREARTLSKIRHESVQLFLGVCLDLRPDSVALVMSDIKGESLHSLLHKKRQEFPFAALTKYINQIAQGMAYLHDRGIAHPLLTSNCISIHYRVCISMLSPAFCSNSVEPNQLVYLPPEVIRTLHATSFPQLTSHPRPPCHTLSTDPVNQDSTDANIFSFGTIVYEMVTMSRPFATARGELIIWEVGNNRHQSLHSMNSGKLKDIVQRCWNSEAELRPSFKELVCTLEHNMSPRACGVNAFFSFSDPGHLAKTGLR